MANEEIHMSEDTAKEFTLEDLSGITPDPEEQEKVRQQQLRGTRMPFGKHKGRLVNDLPTGYLTWLREWLIERDIFPDLLEAVKHELEARGLTDRRVT